MDANLDACASFTFAQEGGYSSVRGDAGNWSLGVVGRGVPIGSNLGVSAPALIAYLRRVQPHTVVTAAYMRALPRSVATAIMSVGYWNPLRGCDLPSGIDMMTFDFGYNAGTETSAALLQQCLGFAGSDVDGSIGPATIAAAATADPAAVINALAARQAAYYRALPQYPVFGKGWIARTGKRQSTALGLVPVAGEVLQPGG